MIDRRRFLQHVSLAGLATSRLGRAATPAARVPERTADERRIIEMIDAHRPSRMERLPADFNARFGATHSDGKYYLTRKPFLIEGAEKLLSLGTRLGKFWFEPQAVKKFYSFHSEWPDCDNLVELAKCDYFSRIWAMPFETIMLTAGLPVEQGWRKAKPNSGFHEAVTKEYYRLAAHLYSVFGKRPVTVILQNWEGDWLLRGIGKSWVPPSADWRERCERMQEWIAARQAGVTKARAEFGANSRCTVAHAVEVNRVADGWKGIPTVTRNVLPGVEVDLVSYSAYDGINSGDPLLFWRCLDEIRGHIRTGPLFGPAAVAVGEYGIPENDRPERIRERCDEMLGVMLAKNVRFSAYWEVYCNEFAGKPATPPPTPVSDPKRMRGFWLVKPDGSLSEGGKYFSELWARAAAEGKGGVVSSAVPDREARGGGER